MEYLPIFLDIREQPCLVVGGGEVAARKCALLLRAGAHVTVLAPALGTTLDAERAAGRIAHRASAFPDEDLDGYAVVIAATDDQEVNRAVAAAAASARIPVNVVDQPAPVHVHPALDHRARRRSPSRCRAAAPRPVLARLLRARLETLIPGGLRAARRARARRSATR